MNYLVCSTILLLLGFTKVNGQISTTVTFLKNLIKTGQQSALNFKFPTDAREFEAAPEPIREYDSYDFVIVGGGTAGSVLAHRLAEREDFSVLVLEAGNFSDNGFEQFVRFMPFQVFSKLNWGYTSVPQKNACLGLENESCLIPQGKGVGGSTIINAAAYCRGHPENYNQWATITQDPTWKYTNVLKYFKKSEHFHWTNREAPVDFKYHGTTGEIQVQHRVPDFYLDDAFFEATKKFGYHPTDYNGPNPKGTSIFQWSTKNGRRQDMGSVYIKPFLKQPNLKILTGAYVVKIEINSRTKEAESVLFTNSGTTHRVKAKKEIILSAGSVGSPKILILSGIGPRKHLEELGIDLVQDLEVGSNLQDHCAVGLRVSSDVHLPKESLDDQVIDYLNGRGTLTATTVPQSVGFYNFQNNNNSVPNTEIIQRIFTPSNDDRKLNRIKRDIYPYLWGNNGSHILFTIINLAPKSVGTIRLKSKDPFEYPLIDMGFLSDPNNEDIDRLYQGIDFILKLIQTKPYRRLNAQYLAGSIPSCKHLEFKSKKYWYCFIRYMADEFYHFARSCPMGRNKYSGAVVDNKLQVFGVKKLRVVNASVFPTMVTTHTAMTVVMVAEKAGDIIKLKYSL